MRRPREVYRIVQCECFTITIAYSLHMMFQSVSSLKNSCLRFEVIVKIITLQAIVNKNNFIDNIRYITYLSL